MKPKPRMILQNPKSVRTFFDEEKESRERFSTFEKTNPKVMKDGKDAESR
jgi:hypothetical protein